MKVTNLGKFNNIHGKVYEVIESVSQSKHSPVKGPKVILDGSISYETSCGKPVNVKDGKFVTWDDEVLTSC